MTTKRILLAHSLGARLSRHAFEVFRAADVTRDPDWTVSPGDLMAMLGDLGLPVSESVLLVEELAGGAVLMDPPGYVGRYAGLKRSGPLTTLKARLRKLEIELGSQGSEESTLQSIFPHPRRWTVCLNQDGVVWYCGKDDVSDVPAFDSFVQWFEVLAILLEGEVKPVVPWHTRSSVWHRVWIEGHVGARLAEELGADPFPPAMGTWCSTWIREPLHILEQRTPGYYDETLVTTTDTDQAVDALRIGGDTQFLTGWSGPGHEPRTGEKAAFTFGSTFVWGTKGNYRIGNRPDFHPAPRRRGRPRRA